MPTYIVGRDQIRCVINVVRIRRPSQKRIVNSTTLRVQHPTNELLLLGPLIIVNEFDNILVPLRS